MKIDTIVCGAYGANAYLVYDERREDAILIDAGDDLPAIRRAVSQSGKRLAAIVLTHGHFDHILAAQPLRAETGAPILIHENDAAYLRRMSLNLYDAGASRLPFVPCEADERLATPGGEASIARCGLIFDVINTKGHTPGGICLYAAASRAIFTGDTLFADGYGRVDFPGGDAGEMALSLKRLARLPDDVWVYPGHGPSALIGAMRGGLL